MKLPKYPIKPEAPYKPFPPLKTIETSTYFGEINILDEFSYSIDEWKETIKELSKTDDLSSIKFSFTIDQEPTYYDQTITTLILKVSKVNMVDNPNYERQNKEYENALKKYKADYKKYREKLKEYKEQKRLYQENIDKYNLERSKEQVAANYMLMVK